MRTSRWSITGPLTVAGLAVLLLACGDSKTPERRSSAPRPAARPRVSQGEEQVALLRAQLVRNPDDAVQRRALADKLYDLGRDAEAVDQYALYLVAQPDDLGARTDMGTCYKRLGNLKRALSAYEHVLTKDDVHLMALYNAGIVVQLMDRPDLARSYFERAVTADPGGRVGTFAEERLRESPSVAGTMTPPTRPGG